MTAQREAGGIVMNYATFRRQWMLAPFLEACAAAGMTRVSIWGDAVASLGEAQTQAMLRDLGLRIFGYNRAGPLLAAEAADRAACLDTARAEVRRAAELGADHILAFTGGLPPGERGLADGRARAADAIAELLDEARVCGVTLALEPLHPLLAGDRTVLCTLDEANTLCAALGDGVGIVVDTHHVWWDARLEEQLARATSRLVAFHVNDWLVPLPDPLAGRGMMGDGIIDLAGLWSMMRAHGYRGPIEVEIFSDKWWAEPPDAVLNIALERCKNIFGVSPGTDQSRGPPQGP